MSNKKLFRSIVWKVINVNRFLIVIKERRLLKFDFEGVFVMSVVIIWLNFFVNIFENMLDKVIG